MPSLQSVNMLCKFTEYKTTTSSVTVPMSVSAMTTAEQCVKTMLASYFENTDSQVDGQGGQVVLVTDGSTVGKKQGGKGNKNRQKYQRWLKKQGSGTTGNSNQTVAGSQNQSWAPPTQSADSELGD